MSWSAESIAALRTRLGLSQTALAKTLGCSQASVWHWERGTRPPTRYWAAKLTLLDAGVH